MQMSAPNQCVKWINFPLHSKLTTYAGRYGFINIVATIFLSLFLVLNAYAVELSNFKSGLACTDAKTFGWICHETEKIYVTGQGACEFDGQNKPCTWHGFQFDYTGLSDEEKIECKFESTAIVTLGNPSEVTESDINSGTYTLPIKPGEGHFFNPQYVVLTFKSSPNKESTKCYVGEKLLFEYKNEFIYPKQP